MVVRELVASFFTEVDIKPLKQADRAMDDLTKKVKSFGTMAGLSIGFYGAARGAKYLVDQASNVVEVVNVLDQVFGANAESVKNWANVTAKEVHRSEFALRKSASQFGAFLEPQFRGTEVEFDKMSTTLSKLAVDLASFYDMNDAEAQMRLFSGMSGETEAVRRLGIDISDEALERYNREEKHDKRRMRALSLTEKSLLRFEKIMIDTQRAQGDAARTADQFANRQRELIDTMKQSAAEAGAKLIPMAKRFVDVAIPAVIKLGEAFQFLAENTAIFETAIVALGANTTFKLLNGLGGIGKSFAAFGGSVMGVGGAASAGAGVLGGGKVGGALGGLMGGGAAPAMAGIAANLSTMRAKSTRLDAVISRFAENSKGRFDAASGQMIFPTFSEMLQNDMIMQKFMVKQNTLLADIKDLERLQLSAQQAAAAQSAAQMTTLLGSVAGMAVSLAAALAVEDVVGLANNKDSIAGMIAETLGSENPKQDIFEALATGFNTPEDIDKKMLEEAARKEEKARSLARRGDKPNIDAASKMYLEAQALRRNVSNMQEARSGGRAAREQTAQQALLTGGSEGQKAFYQALLGPNMESASNDSRTRVANLFYQKRQENVMMALEHPVEAAQKGIRLSDADKRFFEEGSQAMEVFRAALNAMHGTLGTANRDYSFQMGDEAPTLWRTEVEVTLKNASGTELGKGIEAGIIDVFDRELNKAGKRPRSRPLKGKQ